MLSGRTKKRGADSIAPFELIPWVLGQCASTAQARTLLQHTRILPISFSESLPVTDLHWLISDRAESLVVESLSDGLHLWENPVGVLTNNPSFDWQLTNLSAYQILGFGPPENRLVPQLALPVYSRGMGGFGLPGDLSSASRFVRAAFTKFGSITDGSEQQNVSQFFHILGAVCQQRGTVRLAQGVCQHTIYSSCCNTDKGIYYYTTYDGSGISAVHLFHGDLDTDRLIKFPLYTAFSPRQEN